MQDKRVMGVSIAIVDNQKIVWAQGFGFADEKNKVPATAETVYRLGSISKLFTVMAALQLAERKKVDIDQPLKTYLPQFTVRSRFPDSDPITLRTMMTHHSGLPADIYKGALTSEPPSALLSRLKDEYVAYPPNFVLAYSNVAMALLGLMVERVSGTQFSEYMDQYVLAPIGMPHSSFSLTPEIKNLLSNGYRNGEEVKQVHLRDTAAGSMYSNVLDLSRFMQVMFAQGRVGHRQILQPATIDEMLRPQNETVALDFEQRIGLGWFLIYAGQANEKIATHAGNLPLFHTTLAILPEKKIGIVVLTNSAEGRRIYDKIAGEALKLTLEAKTGIALEKRERKIPPPDKIAAEKMLQDFVGEYATLNLLGTVERHKQTLDAHIGGYQFQLIPSSNGIFGVERKWLGIFPIRKVGNLDLAKIRARRMDVAGRKLLIVNYDGRHWFTAEKIDPTPLPDAWGRALGTYQVINPDPEGSIQDVTLARDQNLLVFTYNHPVWGDGIRKMYFRSISGSEAVALGIGRNSGETMRIVNIDNEIGLQYKGFKMKR